MEQSEARPQAEKLTKSLRDFLRRRHRQAIHATRVTANAAVTASATTAFDSVLSTCAGKFVGGAEVKAEALVVMAATVDEPVLELDASPLSKLTSIMAGWIFAMLASNADLMH